MPLPAEGVEVAHLIAIEGADKVGKSTFVKALPARIAALRHTVEILPTIRESEQFAARFLELIDDPRRNSTEISRLYARHHARNARLASESSREFAIADRYIASSCGYSVVYGESDGFLKELYANVRSPDLGILLTDRQRLLDISGGSFDKIEEGTQVGHTVLSMREAVEGEIWRWMKQLYPSSLELDQTGLHEPEGLSRIEAWLEGALRGPSSPPSG